MIGELAAHPRMPLPRRLPVRFAFSSMLVGILASPAPRILDLRANSSAHDATYVALAERLDAALLTGDDGLRRAARSRTRLAVLP
ncbi:MAG: hypothetical protein KatS3mg014_0696 [Actinomycetota bacterium]|nr:MAG: hypothetical protein KatS3mg014_0696 [Actinomycetota bacterium]